MSKRRIKLMIWAMLVVLALGAMWGAVRGAAYLLLYFQRGADPASALNIVPNVPADLKIDVTWLPDDDDTGRTIDPFTRSQLEATYMRSWLQWNLSYVKGQPYGMKTYFTGPALVAASAAVNNTTAKGLKIDQTDLVHHLKLHFYSADGSIVSFTDYDVIVAQAIRDSSGAVVFAGETRADYDVVMMLDNGNWQVRHWLRQAASVESFKQSSEACLECVKMVRNNGHFGLRLNDQPFHIAGINYYPQATPWDLFWTQYSPAVIDRDLSRIKGLGLNTIRIFVPYEQFGGAKVDPQMLDRLRDLLDRAEAQDLKVIVTLFDFRADYDLLHWADADRQLETLLTTFVEHPAILAWDLKNEPDLDYARVGREVVNAWLEHVALQARRFDSNHLITIGWSSPDAAQQLIDKVDLVQFHYYGLASDLQEKHESLRKAADEKPIFLGEFGLPTWNSIFPHGHTEAEQASYYAELLTVLRKTDSAGYLAWTLYDFTNVPASVAGRWPWQTGPQRNLGILRADESAKPAAALLMPDAVLAAPAVPTWARYVKPFWLLIFAVGAIGSLAGCWLAFRTTSRIIGLRKSKIIAEPVQGIVPEPHVVVQHNNKAKRTKRRSRNRARNGKKRR